MTATADDTGQSRLEKNSFHSVLPIISVCEPPSRSGMTNSPTAGMKTSRQPAMTPGSDSGKVIFQKARGRRAAEILGGLDQRIVHLLQRRIERQHHEGQIGIDDADEDRRSGVEDDQRLVDDVQREQQLVEQPLGLEDADPGVDADQEEVQNGRITSISRVGRSVAGARAMP